MKTKITFIAIFIACLIYSILRHQGIGIFGFGSEFCADAAGYYIYLPATFYYGFETSGWPANINQLLFLDLILEDGRIIFTKYTYGVALLQLPFFLIASALSWIFPGGLDGFTIFHQKAVNFSAVAYLCIGLYFLYKTLIARFSPIISAFVLSILFFGTNLSHLGLVFSGLSHAYSFCLVSILVYCVQGISLNNEARISRYVVISLLVSLLIIIRPTIIIILSALIFWDSYSWKDLKLKLEFFLNRKFISIFILSFFLFSLPQALYWYALNGTFIFYSYEEEVFANWLNPKILEVWFSANNGLFPYSLALILVVIGIVVLIVKKNLQGFYSLLIFLYVSYYCGAWDDWHFGCSFGQRNFVEYYPLFTIPIGTLLLMLVHTKNKILKCAGIISILLLLFLNFGLNHYYTGCVSFGTWDMRSYLNLFKFIHFWQ